MAIILTEKGDYFGGQETSILANQCFDRTNPEHHIYLSSNFNNLAIANNSLSNYTGSIKYFQEAIKLSKDSLANHIYLNNIARSYQGLSMYKEALSIYNRILKQPHKSQIEYARVVANIARTKWLQDSKYDAEGELMEALKIRKQENDLPGLNSSYAHLADFYTDTQPQLALAYARQMYTVACDIGSADNQILALQKLIRLVPPDDTKQLFIRYHQLTDSVQQSRNAAKNQFALIRYEAKKHEADNLILQRDNADKKYQIIILIIVIVLSAIATFFWYRKRKQKIELKARNVINENLLRTSKKVHDVVANGLYRVMTEIENRDHIDKEHILDKIEELYEKSRDISYDDPNKMVTSFPEQISALLQSFATNQTKMLIAGNTQQLWENISTGVRFEIEHILQELMVNMKKHSKATSVAVRFQEREKTIFIYYTDNGIGIPADITFNNGLRNTGNRIKAIHGEITFDTEAELGLKIRILFPVS